MRWLLTLQKAKPTNKQNFRAASLDSGWITHRTRVVKVGYIHWESFEFGGLFQLTGFCRRFRMHTYQILNFPLMAQKRPLWWWRTAQTARKRTRPSTNFQYLAKFKCFTVLHLKNHRHICTNTNLHGGAIYVCSQISITYQMFLNEALPPRKKCETFSFNKSFNLVNSNVKVKVNGGNVPFFVVSSESSWYFDITDSQAVSDVIKYFIFFRRVFSQ